MTPSTRDAASRIDPRRAHCAADWRVDDLGCLHTDTSAGLAERVVVECATAEAVR